MCSGGERGTGGLPRRRRQGKKRRRRRLSWMWRQWRRPRPQRAWVRRHSEVRAPPALPPGARFPRPPTQRGSRPPPSPSCPSLPPRAVASATSRGSTEDATARRLRTVVRVPRAALVRRVRACARLRERDGDRGGRGERTAPSGGSGRPAAASAGAAAAAASTGGAADTSTRIGGLDSADATARATALAAQAGAGAAAGGTTTAHVHSRGDAFADGKVAACGTGAAASVASSRRLSGGSGRRASG